MIEISHLSKRYGTKLAVDDLNLHIKKGEIVGFLGPNGAGKSTTMNMVTGYISATEGYVKINGIDILEQPEEAKCHIGYLPEQPPLYMDMTVREYLSFVYDLKKVKKDKEKHLADCMTLVKIKDVADRRIKNLSKGYRQRVGLAQALLGNPEVLILDEPTVGLDPQQILEIRDIIKKLGKNHTVILSSHIMQEISAVCERIVIISSGKIVADNTLDHLTDSLSGYRLEIEVEAPWEKAENVFGALGEITLKGEANGVLSLTLQSEQDVRKEIFTLCAKENMPLLTMKNDSRTLEEIFLSVTAGKEEE